MSKLYRLFYSSRKAPDVHLDSEVTIREILRSSIDNNQNYALTGILVSIQDVFIQALEGHVDSVRNTYARISMDRRHRDLNIISQGPVQYRLFSDWNMCARILSGSDLEILKILDSKGRFNPTALTPKSVQILLTTVADIQRRTLDQSQAAVERA